MLQSPELPEEIRTSRCFAVRVNFFVGGIIHTYQQWIQGELNCPLDEITADIARLIVSSAATILDPDWPR